MRADRNRMAADAHGRRWRALGGPRLLGASFAAACVLAGSPALAAAATRYATVDATATTGACPQTAPCTLQAAVTSAASGDEVVVAPGDYTLSQPLHAGQPISLHGVDGQVAPRILASASVGGPFAVALKAGSSVRHLVISTGVDHQAALDLASASADDLVLSAHGAGASPGVQAALMIATGPATPTVVRDTVAWADGAAMAAVGFQHDVGGTEPVVGGSAAATPQAQLINVTAIATGSGSTGVESSGDAGTLSFTDVIARGASMDIAGPTVSAGASYSDFRSGQSSGVTDQGHNLAGQPQFAAPASGDFHELPGSPTVDAGVLTGQSGATDPDGTARVLGAAPDIGAYELAPGAATSGGDLSGPALGGSGSGSGASLGSLDGPGIPPLTTASGAPLAAPVAAHSVDVAPAQGQVLVKLPGAAGFAPLAGGQQLPVGSTVDTTAGTVELVSARDFAGTLQAGRFWGGRFVVTQHGAQRLVTQLVLNGAMPSCPVRRAASLRRPRAGHVHDPVAVMAVNRRTRTRLLWGSDNHGQFSTRGRNAVATVRGTVWMTQDSCAGTLTKVVAGKVTVRNLHNGRTFTVTAGHQRLVPARG